MAGAEFISSVIDRKNGPGLLRSPKTSGNPVFALAGNALGFGGGLLPNAGLLENRTDFEWEMGCISWQQHQQPADAGDFPFADTLGAVGALLPDFINPFPAEKVSEPKSIKFRCNPSDVSWSMPQRSVEQKTKAGTVLHTWNDNDRKTYFDEPVLTFQLQSGNILPPRSILNPRGVVPEGLNNFYEFMSLVDEVKVLDDGRANLCYIDYNSLIFPSIRLWGFWQPSGISFSDSAENHAQVNSWSASFTVYKSFPELGRNIATTNTSIVDGSQAGQSLRQMYNHRSGHTYSNKRSETFGLLQDAAISTQAVVTGQVAPRDIPAAARATINAASQRVVQRASTAAAGAVALAVSGVPNAPRAGGF
jgi:hypothetical protein